MKKYVRYGWVVQRGCKNECVRKMKENGRRRRDDRIFVVPPLEVIALADKVLSRHNNSVNYMIFS